MSQNTLAADTPWDGNFEPQLTPLVTPTKPVAKSLTRPGRVPVGHNSSASTLGEASNSQDALTESSPTSTIVPTDPPNQPLLDKNVTRPASTKSESDSGLFGGRPRNSSWSAESQSTLDQSRSTGALQTPVMKKTKGFLNFLAIKEPSTKALEEFAEQQQRELKERGLKYPFGVSTSQLPEHVPRVNSKWDGLPDNKRDAILTVEKQKKKGKALGQRRGSMSTDNQGEAALLARQYPPTFVPPNSHRSRHSTGSTDTYVTSSSNSESYKSCDPSPRARPSSAVPSLTGGSTSGSVVSPSRHAKFDRSNDDGTAQSDSDMLSSSEDWMPQTPCTPPLLSSNGHRKSAPAIVPLKLPLEDGMRNVAPLLPFATEVRDFEPKAVTRRPDTGVGMRSTANPSSAFLAGEAKELDLTDEAKVTDVQTTLSRQRLLAAVTTAERASFAGNPASPEPGNAKYFRTHHARVNSDSSNAKSVSQLPNDHLGRGDKAKKEGTFRRDTLDIRPPSPTEEPQVLSKNKFRRSFFGKK